MDEKMCKSKEQMNAHWYKLNAREDVHFFC